jgi:hypothetical protein
VLSGAGGKFSYLDDFIRSYTPEEVCRNKEQSEAELDSIFVKMHKLTPEDRNKNCNACGYGSCRAHGYIGLQWI